MLRTIAFNQPTEILFEELFHCKNFNGQLNMLPRIFYNSGQTVCKVYHIVAATLYGVCGPSISLDGTAQQSCLPFGANYRVLKGLHLPSFCEGCQMFQGPFSQLLLIQLVYRIEIDSDWTLGNLSSFVWRDPMVCHSRIIRKTEEILVLCRPYQITKSQSSANKSALDGTQESARPVPVLKISI